MSLFDPNKLPALQPPPGVTPNFINPHSAGAPVGAAIGIFAALATLGFISRIFTKLWIMKEVQVEDCRRSLIIQSCHPLIGCRHAVLRLGRLFLSQYTAIICVQFLYSSVFMSPVSDFDKSLRGARAPFDSFVASKDLGKQDRRDVTIELCKELQKSLMLTIGKRHSTSLSRA